MKLSGIKKHLITASNARFLLKDGTAVPDHFHITEVGVITRNYIDCGGTIRNEKIINFQLWNANDTGHRLRPGKLLNIIKLAEKALGMEDLEIEVEYQSETIGKYGLEFQGGNFILTAKQTGCLGKHNCDVPAETQKARSGSLNSGEQPCCATRCGN